MYLTLTNMGTEPEAIYTPNGSYTSVLHSQQAQELRDDAITVAIIGDKPDLRETLETAAGALKQVAREILRLIAGRKKHAEQRTGKAETVAIYIANHGANGIRVILGDGVTDVEIQPGQSQRCDAAGYLELRELGLVNNPEQPEAS